MNEFLTQSQLAERLVQKTGIQPEIAKKFSSVFFTIVKKGLKTNKSFAVYGFGTFKKTWIEATTGINPSSGEKINIPAHWRIKFTPCAAVAKRLNRPYGHLTAKEVPEDTILPDEEPTSSIPAAIVQPEEDDEDDLNIPEEKAVSRKNFMLIGIAGILIVLLILLVSLLFRGCSHKSSSPKMEKIPEDEKLNAKASEESPSSSIENEEFTFAYTDFAVPEGSDYHSIAEDIYGNRHLWPLIFSANKNISTDPDFVPKYRTIRIPQLPKGAQKDGIISKAVLEAYNAYLLMCEKEPDSKKNPERKRLATRVLVSGELLVPGFIAEYNNRILPECAEMASNIILIQYQ